MRAELPHGPQFLKARAIAARFGVSTKTVHRWAEAGLIKKRKLSQRLVLFDVSEVILHIEKGVI